MTMFWCRKSVLRALVDHGYTQYWISETGVDNPIHNLSDYHLVLYVYLQKHASSLSRAEKPILFLISVVIWQPKVGSLNHYWATVINTAWKLWHTTRLKARVYISSETGESCPISQRNSAYERSWPAWVLYRTADQETRQQWCNTTKLARETQHFIRRFKFIAWNLPNTS